MVTVVCAMAEPVNALRSASARIDFFIVEFSKVVDETSAGPARQLARKRCAGCPACRCRPPLYRGANRTARLAGSESERTLPGRNDKPVTTLATVVFACIKDGCMRRGRMKKARRLAAAGNDLPFGGIALRSAS